MTNLVLMPTGGGPPFPSDEHHAELKEKGFKLRTSSDDMFYWHAYDYGWRRVLLQRRDDHSPIDPDRQWFKADLVAAAEGYWSRKHRSRPAVEKWSFRVAAAYRWAYERREVMPPNLSDGHPLVVDLVQRYEAAREDALASQHRERVEAATQIIGDGKNPDGSNSAESIAYVALCCRQFRANMNGFAERNEWMKRMPDNSPMPTGDSAADDLSQDQLDELARVREALGVKVVRGFGDPTTGGSQ